LGVAAGFFGLVRVVGGDGGGGDGVDEVEGLFEDGAGAGLTSGGRKVFDTMEEGEENIGGLLDVGLAKPKEEIHEGLLSGVPAW
jgi:hypothetical protein